MKEDINHRYNLDWGNFKSDKWKSKTILMLEIGDILRYLLWLTNTKKELIEIKDYLKNKFREKCK